jgi:hypothetical protein
MLAFGGIFVFLALVVLAVGRTRLCPRNREDRGRGD